MLISIGIGVLACSFEVWGCYAIVAGREASADGSVLVGHNEQNYGQRLINFRKIPRRSYDKGETVTLAGGATIPQVRETYAFLWSENPGLHFSDGYMNEWGVAVVSDGCPDRGEDLEELEKEGQVVKGGIGYMLRRLIVERARTARQGVEVAGQIISQVGYSSSRTLVIADAKDAWLLAMARGKQWVAQRVPDDEVALLPNVYTIGEVNLKDSRNFMGSPDLIAYAEKKGWCKKSSGKPFRFYEAYGGPGSTGPDTRQWIGQALVTRTKIFRPGDRKLPFSVKPARPLTVDKVIEFLRYHDFADLCSLATQEGAVFQLRGNMPPEIGCIYWRTTGEPCTSGLTPWYGGVTQTPQDYYQAVEVEKHLSLTHHFDENPKKFQANERLAWWTFKKLQDAVNANRVKHHPTVRETWDRFESEIHSELPKLEKTALELYQRDRAAGRAYLTNYCEETALAALELARLLIEKVQP